MNPRTLVAFEGVALGYGARTVVRDLDLDVPAGDFLGIVGPNGAGKTTILRGLLGLLRPRRGRILFQSGRPRDSVHFGYVPQRETIDETYPLSVADVVMMGRYRLIGRGRRPGSEDRREVREALEASGIPHLADSPFRKLSGGQKQRTLIARALAARPDLLVLDEPTSGMDLRGETAVMELVSSLHRDQGLTVVMVSHQLNTVARWVRRIALLHDGVMETGPIDEILTGERLRRVYGSGADVVTVQGHRVVLPPHDGAFDDTPAGGPSR